MVIEMLLFDMMNTLRHLHNMLSKLLAIEGLLGFLFYRILIPCSSSIKCHSSIIFFSTKLLNHDNREQRLTCAYGPSRYPENAEFWEFCG